MTTSKWRPNGGAGIRPKGVNQVKIPILLPVAVVAALLAQPSMAQQVPGPYGVQVTLAEARAIVDAAHRAAKARNFRMAFAVALPSGEPILLEVMDGTQSASIVVSQQKARSSARYRRPTKAFADTLAAGNLGPLTLSDAVAVEGGVPLIRNGLVIGALGVSGGTSAEDGQVAAAALAASVASLKMD
jgi:glc operon protein GlcG